VTSDIGITAADVWNHGTKDISNGLTAQQVWEYGLRSLTTVGALTPEQNTMLIELCKLGGLIVGSPLIVNNDTNTIQAGNILQSVVTNGNITTVTRA
jgi:hypothetical protein